MTFARPDIKPAFAERNVAVAISTDESYLPHAKVLVNSIVASTKGGNVDMLIVHCGLPPGQRKSFLSCFAETKNLSVRFIDVRPVVESTELAKFKRQTYLSAAACYRLFLPDVLVSYDKLIYLDIDTIVCRDLGELYDVDVADNLIGAVLDVVNSGGRREYAEWARGHGFNEWDRYVNTGVLLFNLAEFRKASLFDKLLPIAVEASKWFCDQDALNFICKGRIAHLDPRWNVQVGDYCIDKQLSIVKGEAYVYHFTGRKKPWDHPGHPYACSWWRHSGDAGRSMWCKCLGLSKANDSSVDVSVVIPVFNAEPYLWKCLMSVLNMPGSFHAEVICIDDGSTDGSLAILQTIQRLDPRVRLVSQCRQGPGAARNAGIAAARGEYVMFLDADDALSSGEALSHALAKAKSSDLDVLVAAGRIICKDGVVADKAYIDAGLIPGKEPFKPLDLGPSLYMLTSMCPWGKLFRRSFLESHSLKFPPLRRSEDFPFVQLAMSLAERMGALDEAMCDHRIDVPTSLESTKDETPLLFIDAEKMFRGMLSERGLQAAFGDAARAAFAVRADYNLRELRSFGAFCQVVDALAKEYAELIGAEPVRVGGPSIAARERVVAAMESRGNAGRLPDVFADYKVRKASADAAKAWGAKVAGKNGQLASLKKSLEAVKSVRDVAIRSRDVALKTLDATRTVRDAALKERDSLRGTLDATRAVRDAALKERDTLRGTLDATRSVRDAALKERDTLRGTLDATRAVRDAALKERDSLRGTLDATRAVRDAALKGRDSLQRTLDAARTVRDAAIKERNALRGKVDALSKACSSAQSERDAVGRELASLRDLQERIRDVCGEG